MNHPESLSDPDFLTASFRKRLSLEGAVADTPITALSSPGLIADANELSNQYQRVLSEGFDEVEPFSVILDPVISNEEGEIAAGASLRLPSPKIQTEDGSTLTVTGRISGLRLLRSANNPGNQVWTMLEFVHGKQIKVRHLLQSWLQALLLSTSSGNFHLNELRVFRLGGRDFPARRYFFEKDAMTEGDSGDRCLLNHSDKTLLSLAEIRRQGRRLPVLLHPDLAEALWKEENKSDTFTTESLPEAARTAWDKIIDNSQYSKLQACPYRRRFVHSPIFSSTSFSDFWLSLYRDGGIL